MSPKDLATVEPQAAQEAAVAVYCASSSHLVPAFYELARLTGRLLARAGLGVVCGGGNMGMMAAVIDGCLEAGGRATGVIPEFMDSRGWAHTGMTAKIVTADMHQRKALMARLSCGAIALPGGIGTLDELMEIMTWRQLGLYDHPVLVVDHENFYAPLRLQLEQMRRQGFMRAPRELAQFVATPLEAVQAITKSLGEGKP